MSVKRKISIKRLLLYALLVFIVTLAFYPSPDVAPIRYIDRQTGEMKTEKVAGEDWLVWLYYNPLGEAALHTLVKRKFVSDFYGWLMDTRWSSKKIEPFINDFDIDMSIAKRNHFKTFNDFFTRKLKPDARPVDTNSNVVVSPGDGKLLVYENIKTRDFIVKGYRFNINSYLRNDSLAALYSDGSMALLRLCPTDYHRYHFPLSGTVSPEVIINGDLYSVSPIALRDMPDVFLVNKRKYVILANRRFGDVIVSEIGATMVGSIVQTYKGSLVKKGEEKGYFKFGGSSLILLFKKGVVKFDEDLIENTSNGLETEVRMGERIGVRE